MSTSNQKYDVYLSFRGVDTRGFASHLNSALSRKGRFYTFRDDIDLKKGNEIEPSLLSVIGNCKCAVVILSKNYASSRWCLEELVYIIECRKLTGLQVVPVFYDVEPSDVRYQIGNIGEALARLGDNFDSEIVNKWRTALSSLANLSGWAGFRSDYELVENIVEGVGLLITRALNFTISSIEKKYQAGIDSRAEKIMSRYLMGRISNDVRTIGVCGIRGIGKTSVAQKVYKNMKDQFNDRCLIKNVSEESKKFNGIVDLQKLLCMEILNMKESELRNFDMDHILATSNIMRSKRLLLVIDNVDELKQIEALVGKRYLLNLRFGSGSIIIITARDEQLFNQYGVGVDDICKVDKLSDDEALQLLSLNVFETECPPNAYTDHSKKMVKYCMGIPSTIEHLASLLRGKTVDKWSLALETLEKDFMKAILATLQPYRK